MAGRKSRALARTAVVAGLFLAGRSLLRRSPSYSFRGKNILIMGGSRGLGLVLAREFVREGARVALCARNPDELDRAQSDLQQHGGDVLCLPCDVADREQVQQAVNEVLRQWGRIDILVNNAGVIQAGPMETMLIDDYAETLQVHFWGPLYAVQAVLPEMRRLRSGRIVNISSIGGKLSMPHLLPYCASKFALVGLSQGLRAKLAQDGIVVTTVCPGLMRTGSPRNAYFKGRHRAEYAWFTISDSLPLASISAEKAARRIVEACRRGTAEVMLSAPARAAALFHGIFPGLTADLLGWVNRLLPGPGGIGSHRARGRDSESAWTESVLTRSTALAAARNNENSD